ncbi:XRE family transcriptional regulator [Actinoplanes sp. LDG1-06]|uniref:XRE family transcriptional regulator n=1 Tax=Paractinoplanes ovalisporus TaxID=2810368 RepID=A0ABS2AVH1_9ACTN|nr:XRE family transcriptional regulator [Actinoplanes ovalisporus]MBM2623872.1 XRE family transcriptional regulator [Actinoplanes ovalisporus]
MQRKDGDPRLASLQSRLNYLFESVRPAGKPRYSVREVSEAIRHDQGFEISGAYINQLCTGKKDNPGVQQVRALAKFFGVPAGFLFGDGDLDATAGQIELLRSAIEAKEEFQQLDEAMNDPSVRLVAMKARNLSPSHLGFVSAVLDEVRRLEGLGERDDPASP